MKASWIRWWAWLLVAAATLWLSGCASTYTLDNRVQSFTQLTELPASATFRFERLPSQQQDLNQAQLEALADPALHQAGLRRDDASPRYTIQVSATVIRMLSPWADPWWNGWGWGYGYGRHYAYYGMWSGMDYPWYHREVSVIIRELSSNRVVYETRAINDGPWHDSMHVLPAMFQAAMQGFPAPPPGPRLVNIPVPG